MKKFIFKLVGFFCVVIVCSTLIDVCLTAIVKNSNGPEGEIQVWNDIYKKKINASLAIYGSSRAWVHIDPKVLEDSLGISGYNFGLDGHNFWLQHLRHKELLANNDTPKIIILSVDVFSFTKRKDLYLSEQFLPYMLWNETIRSYTKSYEGFHWYDFYVPSVRYLGKRKIIRKLYFDNPEKPYRKLGYKAVKKTWNKDFENAQKNRENFKMPIDASSVALFKTFLEECQTKDIKLIMVYTPEYIDGQKFIKNRDEIFFIFNELSHRYEIPFLDYSENKISKDKKYFYNASHLNRTGSQQFSRILASDLKSLLSSAVKRQN